MAFHGVFVHPGFGRSFENHIFPTLGKRETANLKPAELVAVILPIWAENNDTGTRLCQRIQAVFDQAIKIDDDGRFKDKGNVAAGLLNRLPAGLRPPVQHMRAAQWRERPSLYATLCGAPHANEVFGMKWGEVQGNQWHVPGNRMKGRLPRIVPLPDEAMAILREIEPPNASPTAFVFAGSAAGGRINHQAMRLLLRELGYGYDVHGFRTTFKSFCLDNLKHVLDEPAVELAHDHAIGGKVAETYRGTSFGDRRILNERWARS